MAWDGHQEPRRGQLRSGGGHCATHETKEDEEDEEDVEQLSARDATIQMNSHEWGQ